MDFDDLHGLAVDEEHAPMAVFEEANPDAPDSNGRRRE